jgi:hypothetical protein
VITDFRESFLGQSLGVPSATTTTRWPVPLFLIKEKRVTVIRIPTQTTTRTTLTAITTMVFNSNPSPSLYETRQVTSGKNLFPLF